MRRALLNITEFIRESNHFMLNQRLDGLLEWVDNEFQWDVSHDVVMLEEGEDAPFIVEDKEDVSYEEDVDVIGGRLRYLSTIVEE